MSSFFFLLPVEDILYDPYVQVCMQVAASVAYYCQSMVAYVDTCHSFSSTRLSHMLGGLVAARDGIPVCCTPL